MPVTAVNSASTVGTTAATSRGTSSLSSEDFYKILVTELQQQDPMEPTKTADMIGQVSQIRSIELSSQLNSVLTQLSRQQRASGASDLLGRYVTATVADDNGDAQEVSGLVTGIHFDPTGAMVLELDNGQSVLASSVTRIATEESAADPALTGDTNQSGSTDGAAAATAKRKSAAAKPQRSNALFPWLSLDRLFQR